MAQSKSFIALCAVVAVQVLCLLVVTTATVAGKGRAEEAQSVASFNRPSRRFAHAQLTCPS